MAKKGDIRNQLFAILLLLVLLVGCDQDSPRPTPLPTPESSTPTAISTSTTAVLTPTGITEASCSPTQGDYAKLLEKNPPVRSSVGKGHVLQGTVKSSRDCSPVAEARVIAWLTSSEGVYSPDLEATLVTDSSGSYRLESNVPGRYDEQPAHIHLWVKAEGYRDLITSYFVPEGKTEGTYDLVIAPVER